MSMTVPDQPRALPAEVLADLQAALVAAVAANDRQRDDVPAGPEADAHQAARAALVDALARIDAGTYGRCTSCGTALPVERLELVPDAEWCMACTQRPRALYG